MLQCVRCEKFYNESSLKKSDIFAPAKKPHGEREISIVYAYALEILGFGKIQGGNPWQAIDLSAPLCKSCLREFQNKYLKKAYKIYALIFIVLLLAIVALCFIFPENIKEILLLFFIPYVMIALIALLVIRSGAKSEAFARKAVYEYQIKDIVKPGARYFGPYFNKPIKVTEVYVNGRFDRLDVKFK